MRDRCLKNNECGQYCQVIDALTDEKPNSACPWPERLDEGYDFSESAQPPLAQRTGNHLLQVLAKGDRIRTLLETPGTEQEVAYKANIAIFDAQFGLWRSYAQAANANRLITDIEVGYYTEQLQQNVAEAQAAVRSAGVSPENLTYAQAIHDRGTLEDHGLLFDEGMLLTVTQLCANAASGRSTLLVGDKGVAKTQAAKFTSGLFASDGKPKFISGDGSMMKDEFIGKMTLTEQNGATVTSFQPGILTECMEQGIPLVMDEINLIDPAIAMRLQDILLRKPGDTVTIQEDGGGAITIKRGFCVLATANEASSRYQSRAALDPAFRDRFNILPIEYPDGETTMLQTNERPAALARLSYAFAVSRSGIANSRISPEDALWLASISHASQQLYSKPAKDVRSGRLSTPVAGVVDDTEPRMTDCITPRKMVDILQTVGGGLNPYDVASGIKGLAMDTIAAMQHSEDRRTMFEIIRLMHDGSAGGFNEAEVRKRLKV